MNDFTERKLKWKKSHLRKPIELHTIQTVADIQGVQGVQLTLRNEEKTLKNWF